MKPNEIASTYRSLKGNPRRQLDLLIAVQQWAKGRLANPHLSNEARASFEGVIEKTWIAQKSHRRFMLSNRIGEPRRR